MSFACWLQANNLSFTDSSMYLARILVLLCFVLPLQAQIKSDSSWVDRCRYTFSLTATIQKPLFSLAISNTEDDLRLKYRTYLRPRLALAFDFRWFGVEIFTNLPVLNAQSHRKGDTRTQSARLTINSRQFSFFFLNQSYKGFYLNDNAIFYNPFSSLNPLPKRPDMSVSFFHTNGFYFFNNKRYSHPAAAGQYERQRKSAGSFSAGLGLLSIGTRVDSSMVPPSFQNQFPNLSLVKSIQSTQIYAAIGYQYTLVFGKKFFFNGAFTPGITRFDRTENYFNNQIAKVWDIGFRFDSRLGIGFNGEHLFYGGQFQAFWSNQRLISGNYFYHTMQGFRFFLGFRFHTRRELKFLGL